jgi:membrane protein DedA with SNARE-associated domain
VLALALSAGFFYLLGKIFGESRWVDWWIFVEAKFLAWVPGGSGARDGLNRIFYTARELAARAPQEAHELFNWLLALALVLGMLTAAAVGTALWHWRRRGERDDVLRGGVVVDARELRRRIGED